MNKKVLFVDNDVDFLDGRVEPLERAGYQVIKATSVEQAEQLLETEWIHAMLIDIRLRDDNDGKDTTGLSLAKQEPYQAIPKIILTRYPSFEYVREVLGPVLDGLPPAVDFLDKREGLEAMLAALEKAFAKHVRLNQTLVIHHEQQLSFFTLANCIEPQIENRLLPARVDELTDLFRRLFLNQDQVTLKRLVTTDNGRIALVVHVFSAYGDEQERVVVCGRPKEIRREIQNHKTFTTPEGRTTITGAAETLHFGALAYRLAGANLAQSMTLAEFYRFNPADFVCKVLARFLGHVLAGRYRAGQMQETERSLDTLMLAQLGLKAENISLAVLNTYLVDLRKKSLSPDLVRNNGPATNLNIRPAEVEKLFAPPFWCGQTYGRLDGEGVLVDRTGESWLIDFSQVARAPLLRDFVALEGSIRFDLLSVLGIEARNQLERRLLQVDRLDDTVPDDDLAPDVQKALQSIQAIRQQAAALDIKLHAYLGGLYLDAAARLASFRSDRRYSRNDLVCFWHSLRLMTAISEKLAPPPPEDVSPQAKNDLWIDERSMVVWVEGQQREPSPQEFEVLDYLYQYRGQLCRRIDIIKNVFKANYDPDDSYWLLEKDNDRLNATIRRLRQSVEPDPGRPKYILTVRGQGYRLAPVASN